MIMYYGEAWTFAAVVEQLKTRFAHSMIMEDGIAINAALSENLFVVVVCILNKVSVPALLLVKKLK